MSDQSKVLEFPAKFDKLTCPACGMDFAVPVHWTLGRKNDHAIFVCPNGHSQHFPKSKDELKIDRYHKALVRISHMEPKMFSKAQMELVVEIAKNALDKME